jgi:dolichol-phosphate hexosyltransferase
LTDDQPFLDAGRLATESIAASSARPDPARQPEGSSRIHHHYDTSFKPYAFKLSILMAAYNEEDTVTRAVDEVLGVCYPFDIELIVVNDGSTDKTGMLLSQLDDERLIVYRHQVNQGKGAALRTAASLATGTYMLPFDADLEYAPEDIPRVLEPVLKGRCSVVYGVRLSGCNTVYRSYRYAMGNRILTALANILFNSNLSDLHTCLKLMPMSMLRDLNPRESGFGLDTEITALLLRRGIRPFEVPVTYHGRSHAEGKKITWRDALACVRILLLVRIRGSRSHRMSVSQVQEPPEGSLAEPDARQELMSVSVSQTLTPENQPNRRAVVGLSPRNFPKPIKVRQVERDK